MVLAPGQGEHDVGAALGEPEQRHRILFEQAPVGVFVYDAHLRIHEFNARFPEILRTSPERLRGLDMHTLRDRRILDALERPLRGDAGRYQGPYLTTTSGAEIYVSLRCAPLRDARGTIVGAMGVVGDATERILAENALRKSEQRFRALVENASDAIVVCTTEDLRVVYANPAAARLLGREDAAELVGRRMDEFVLPDDVATADRRRARVAESTGRLPPQEYRALRKDGVVCHIEVESIRLDYDDRPHIISFARDLTERKRIQARLLLADRMVSVGTLAAGVAHEINNPLAYLMTNLDLLALRRLPALADRLRALGGPHAELADEVAAAIERIEVAREGAGRVRDIVRDLRAFTRPPDVDQLAGVDVRRVLDASVNMAWNEIRHRARLVKEYADVPPVAATEARLLQVFLNLLVNAAQALPVGGAAENTVRVRTSVDAEGHVVVEVSDTGAGIPAEIRDRIFDPFFTTKPVGVGTGLGLWVVQGIVTSFGGTISVDSAPGRGSTFRVSLPVAEHAATAGAHPATGEPARVEARLKLLVVDDEVAMGRTLAIALGDAFDVQTATSGREALERLAGAEHFDVVLCDLMMPDVSGMDLHGRVAAERPELARRFVFVTGGAFTERARAFVAAVGAPVVQKPFQLEALTALLRQRAMPASE